MERIKELLSCGKFLHGDETGIHIKKLLHWIHVACTRLSDRTCLGIPNEEEKPWTVLASGPSLGEGLCTIVGRVMTPMIVSIAEAVLI
jgi:hypothetical protein